MSNKTKNSRSTVGKLTDVTKQGGIIIMAAAATLGMLELPDRSNGRAIVVPNQPTFAMATHNVQDQGQSNQMRRERDETVQHYISYSISQRTPSRSGKH